MRLAKSLFGHLAVSLVLGTAPLAAMATPQTIVPPDSTASDTVGANTAIDTAGDKLLINTTDGFALMADISGTWTVIATFTTANIPVTYSCPCSVALSGDGNTVLIGESGSRSSDGSAYLFRAASGIWAASPVVVATFGSGGNIGTNVALSADGNTAVVASPGAAKLYQAAAGTWVATPAAVATVMNPACCSVAMPVALSADGDTWVAGSTTANTACPTPGTKIGAAVVYQASSSSWAASPAPVATLPLSTQSDNCSTQAVRYLTVSADGDTVLVGPGGLLYQADSGSWAASPTVTATLGTALGSDSAGTLSADGKVALIGVPALTLQGVADNSSGALLYIADSGVWHPSPAAIQSFTGSNCQGYGTAVALSADATESFVGQPNVSSLGHSCAAIPGQVDLYASANIGLTGSGSMSSAMVAVNFSYDFTVTNEDSTEAAQDVTLTDVLPAGAVFVSASSGCTDSNGTLTCTMANLPPSGTWNPTVTVYGTVAGSLSNTATVSGNDYNLDFGDAATVTTMITASSSSSGGGYGGSGGGVFDGLEGLLLLAVGLLARRSASRKRVGSN